VEGQAGIIKLGGIHLDDVAVRTGAKGVRIIKLLKHSESCGAIPDRTEPRGEDRNQKNKQPRQGNKRHHRGRSTQDSKVIRWKREKKGRPMDEIRTTDEKCKPHKGESVSLSMFKKVEVERQVGGKKKRYFDALKEW